MVAKHLQTSGVDLYLLPSLFLLHLSYLCDSAIKHPFKGEGPTCIQSSNSSFPFFQHWPFLKELHDFPVFIKYLHIPSKVGGTCGEYPCKLKRRLQCMSEIKKSVWCSSRPGDVTLLNDCNKKKEAEMITRKGINQQ